MRQQVPQAIQAIGGNNGAPQSNQSFMQYSQGNPMNTNQIGGGTQQISNVMNPGLGGQMVSGSGQTIPTQLQPQMSPMGQMGTGVVNQMGSQLGNASLQSQLQQQQRFGGRPAPVSSPMGPPTPVSGPSASPRALPAPSPRAHHPSTPSHSPHPVATPQLDILHSHSPQLMPDDSVLTPQEQLTKYVDQL